MKKVLYFLQIIFIFTLTQVIYAKNDCPKWLLVPDNDLVIVVPIYDMDITEPDLDCDGVIDSVDGDIDGDGVANANDAFPWDASESVDTDNDGIGNNVDLDDDNDGYSDLVEIAAGSDPLDASDTP